MKIHIHYNQVQERFRAYDKAFNKADHPTAPKGASGGTGGEFVKKGTGTTSGSTTGKSPTTSKAQTPSRTARSSSSGHLPGSTTTGSRSGQSRRTTSIRSNHLPGGPTRPSVRRTLPGGTKVHTEMQPVPADRAQWPAHIRGLKIPPAWTDVRYNPDPKGEKLVTGRDAKGHLQPLYSDAHWERVDGIKYAKVKKIIKNMTDYSKKNNKNLSSRDAKTKQHAEALGMIMETGIRPGSERDTGTAETHYGITTLLGQHIVSEGSRTFLRFKGKSGKDQNILIENKELAAAVKDRAKKAGPDGKVFSDINDNSLRRYCQGITNNVANPKDFRTAIGTSMATSIVQSMPAPTDKKSFKKAVKDVCTAVSQQLGNTPDVAFKSYVSPYVWEHWEVKYAK